MNADEEFAQAVRLHQTDRLRGSGGGLSPRPLPFIQTMPMPCAISPAQRSIWVMPILPCDCAGTHWLSRANAGACLECVLRSTVARFAAATGRQCGGKQAGGAPGPSAPHAPRWPGPAPTALPT